MAYKLMVIDDARDRSGQYEKVFSGFSGVEPLYIWTRKDFEKYRETPVDGYLVDIFLDKGDWANTNAAELLKNAIQAAPRSSPVFLVSKLWSGDEKFLDILKQAGESSAKVVQYLAWTEFEEAAKDDDAAKIRLTALRNKLLFELNRWHGRNGYRPEPDEPIRILLLADMQFGDPDTDTAATFSEHWIAKTLKKEDKSPNLIVVAGDVSYSGTPEQFALAEERFTKDLIGPLWGENNIDRYRDMIILVPGNHDVNLRFSACDKYTFKRETKQLEMTMAPKDVTAEGGHHEYALEPFCRFAHKLGNQHWSTVSNGSWVDRRFLHWGIRFFVLNSVAELNADMPDRASISEEDVRKINRSLSDDDPDAIFSIALSHHGLRPTGTSGVEVDNWNKVSCDLFSMHNIRLWLYGHYHDFDARSHNGKPFDNTPLWMVQAPSSRMKYTNRGFCLLELSRQNGQVVDAYVHHYAFEPGKVEKKVSKRVFDKG